MKMKLFCQFFDLVVNLTEFIDFSVAFLETGFSFVTLSEHTFNAWAFLEPFDNKLWLYIFFTVRIQSIFSKRTNKS